MSKEIFGKNARGKCKSFRAQTGRDPQDPKGAREAVLLPAFDFLDLPSLPLRFQGEMQSTLIAQTVIPWEQVRHFTMAHDASTSLRPTLSAQICSSIFVSIGIKSVVFDAQDKMGMTHKHFRKKVPNHFAAGCTADEVMAMDPTSCSSAFGIES